jgi:hypothetical protein
VEVNGQFHALARKRMEDKAKKKKETYKKWKEIRTGRQKMVGKKDHQGK